MKYLVILLFLVGCSSNSPLYRVGDHIMVGRCNGYVHTVRGRSRLESSFTKYMYTVVNYVCPGIKFSSTLIMEEDIDGVVE